MGKLQSLMNSSENLVSFSRMDLDKIEKLFGELSLIFSGFYQLNWFSRRQNNLIFFFISWNATLVIIKRSYSTTQFFKLQKKTGAYAKTLDYKQTRRRHDLNFFK